MLQKLLMIFVALSLIPAAATALEIEGKIFPDEFPAGQDTLTLNGGGVRTKLFMDIYACALYLKTKSHDPKQILEADEPMAIRMIVISGLMNQKKLVSALTEGYEKNTGDQLASIQERVDRFIQAHTGEINPDDMYEYVYVPGQGTSMYKNGTKGITIEGLDFKKATFAIWLGKKPALESLKQGLLGK
jgi:hypothetical protein